MKPGKLKIAHKTLVVVSSAKAMYAVLDKNSGNTADRPPTAFPDYVMDGYSFGMARYGAVHVTLNW